MENKIRTKFWESTANLGRYLSTPVRLHSNDQGEERLLMEGPSNINSPHRLSRSRPQSPHGVETTGVASEGGGRRLRSSLIYDGVRQKSVCDALRSKMFDPILITIVVRQVRVCRNDAVEDALLSVFEI